MTPTFIDLFCGCGGFSLGMKRAGFRCLAAVDLDRIAVDAFSENIPDVGNVLCEDLTKYSPEKLHRALGSRKVDVIVGGPPCQGFSTARQVDGSNHGTKRVKRDHRRLLYRDFLKFVEYFQPKIFVVENVPGMRSAAGGSYFSRLQHEARFLGTRNGLPGYRVHSQIEEAWKLGVPQKRRRQLIIGVRADIGSYFSAELDCSAKSSIEMTLGDAVGDLPALRAGEGDHDVPYDLKRRRSHFKSRGRRAKLYLNRVAEVGKSRNITGHVARPHSARDLRDFGRLREGESSAVAMRVRGEEFEFPYDRSSFKDRYTRQSRNGLCSTIVAHMGKDGLMFIHPTQNRSLTVREAARVQSFPDWFEFPEARTHAFRLIGNAVPPLIAESIGASLKRFIGSCSSDSRRSGRSTRRERTGVDALRALTRLEPSEIAELSPSDFLSVWKSIFEAFPHLHPLNAFDHGHTRVGRRLKHSLNGFGSLYERSGWPIALEAAALEASRRLSAGLLSGRQFMLR
jgi:DNA (cytosine-5)-methyltransferase 1